MIENVGALSSSSGYVSPLDNAGEEVTSPQELWASLLADASLNAEQACNRMKETFPDLPQIDVYLQRRLWREGESYLTVTVSEFHTVEDQFRVSKKEVESWQATREDFKSQYCLLCLEPGGGEATPHLVKILHYTEMIIEQPLQIAMEFLSSESETSILQPALIAAAKLEQCARRGSEGWGRADRLQQQLLRIYLKEWQELGKELPFEQERIDRWLDPRLTQRAQEDPAIAVRRQACFDSLEEGSSSEEYSSEESTPTRSPRRLDSQGTNPEQVDSGPPIASDQVTQDDSPATHQQTMQKSSEPINQPVTLESDSKRSWKRWVLYGSGAGMLLFLLSAAALGVRKLRGA